MDVCSIISMIDTHRRRLEQQRDALLARLHTLPNLMWGSVYERGRKCGRASCACAQGGAEALNPVADGHPGLATRSRDVRLEEWDQVRGLIATYEELWAIVNDPTAVNLALLHGDPPAGRAPKRRAAR